MSAAGNGISSNPTNNQSVNNQHAGMTYQHMGTAQVQPRHGFVPNGATGPLGVSSPVAQAGYPLQYAPMGYSYPQNQMTSAADSNGLPPFPHNSHISIHGSNSPPAFAQLPHSQPVAGVTQLAPGQFYYAYDPTVGGSDSNVQSQGGEQTGDTPTNGNNQTANDPHVDTARSQAIQTPLHTNKSSVTNPYNQTEPRNFAPRADSIPAQPPPPFMIGTAYTHNPNGTQAGAVTGSGVDPFSVAGNDERAIAMIPNHHSGYETPNDNFAVMPHMPISGPPPPEVRAARSMQLNRLTDGPSGLPPAEVALHPTNFPFIESCSQATASDAGVVKIKNVSLHLLPVTKLILIEVPNLPDPLHDHSPRDQGLPWSQLEDLERRPGACSCHHGAYLRQDARSIR